jgi:hypothetical protein
MYVLLDSDLIECKQKYLPLFAFNKGVTIRIDLRTDAWQIQLPTPWGGATLKTTDNVADAGITFVGGINDK